MAYGCSTMNPDEGWRGLHAHTGAQPLARLFLHEPRPLLLLALPLWPYSSGLPLSYALCVISVTFSTGRMTVRICVVIVIITLIMISIITDVTGYHSGIAVY